MTMAHSHVHNFQDLASKHILDPTQCKVLERGERGICRLLPGDLTCPGVEPMIGDKLTHQPKSGLGFTIPIVRKNPIEGVMTIPFF